MSRVLAFVDRSPSDAAVVRTATALADLIGAPVDTITVRTHDGDEPAADPDNVRVIHGEAVRDLLIQLRSDDVAFGVLGSRSVHAKPELAGHVALALLTASPVPLVLVPPHGNDLPAQRPRFLLPLDGTTETTTALEPIATLLANADAEVLVLHVFDSGSIPPFIDSSEDLDILAAEFLLRHLPEHSERCVLRIGAPGPHIIGVVDTEELDGIIIAWQQDLSPGRAEVVRHLIREAHVPIVFVPI
jgi:hypothetical protein